MDNNSMTNDDFFDGRALMSIDQFRPSAPVLENLSLRNITLPTEVDLSDYILHLTYPYLIYLILQIF